MIAAPRDEVELRNLLYTVQLGELAGPIAIRYPRGRGVRLDWKQDFRKIEFGKGEVLKEGSDLAIISVGNIAENVKKAIKIIDSKDQVAHYDAKFIKPLDEKMLHEIFTNFKKVITIEEGVLAGGFGAAILEFASNNEYHRLIKCIGIPDQFVEQGNMKELYEIVKLDVTSIAHAIKSQLNK